MAEASVSPLAVTTAPAMQSQQAPSPSKSSDAEDGPKFYQVLKERTANNNEKQSAKSAANGSDATRNQASAKTEGNTQNEGAPAADTHATLILMMDIPTQSPGGKGSAASGDDLAASADEKFLSGDASTLTTLSDAAAALAAIAAKLAGNSARNEQARLETTAHMPDLTSRASRDTQTNPLATDPSLIGTDTDVALLAAQAGRGSKTGATESEQNFASVLNTAQNQAAHATTQAPGTAAPQTAEPLPRHEISTPVSSRNWADEVSQKVSWVATRDNGRAELVLNPAHLGRIEVSINMNGEHATAAFVAANATAREALQDAMPRLREVLAQSGIQLGQTSVDAGTSGQAQADQQQAARSQASFSRYTGNNMPEPIISSGSRFLNQAGNGMIDTFA